MLMFLQQVLNGFTLGGIYGLVALGLTLVYGILHVPNFAHGALYMVGAFVAFHAMNAWGTGYWVAMMVAAGVVALLAVTSERLVFSRLRNASGIHPMIAAVGIMLFLEASAQAIWGADFQRMPTPYAGVVELTDGISMSAQRLLIVAAALMLMVAMHWFLTRTLTGSTIIVMAQNRDGASLIGVDANRVAMMTFAISGVLAAIASVLYAPVNLVYPAMGYLVITKAFVIIILGGMGSVPGAIIGGQIIGFAESLGAYYVSTDYKDIVAFALLVLILSVRPQGLFPGRGR
ncbi:branched-chain amino acid ABC transporter permease [Diaphorobacter sp. HDW4A]|uniref:branched-chain amino acid ABC transporter permease n=1 Tax=Diaphorobacter sp. HDW4A TaxID=2714924 RepID=UPI001408BAFC|nr:branched-chain amino acid ABC transporter permease [Diaphorobacter sp. HDW4A]QIL79764.1 branched-chain amino acid ABC transporter permease [Diaphorobacter sp. HDW4A]